MPRHLVAEAEVTWTHRRQPYCWPCAGDGYIPGTPSQNQERYLRTAIINCAENRDIACGRNIHSFIILSGLDCSCVLRDHLIRFFSTTGTLFEANLLFCNVKQPNIHVWGAIIVAHCHFELYDGVLILCHKMYDEGAYPNRFIFPSILKACGSLGNLQWGMLIHMLVLEYAFELDVVVSSSLVDMYSKLERLEEAQSVFDCLKVCNIVSWASIMDGHTEHGDCLMTLNLYEKMCKTSSIPDSVIFLCVLKACSKAGTMKEGMHIHHEIIISEFDMDVAVANTLVDMYAKCQDLRSAHKLFERLAKRTVVSWGALITGYAHHGLGGSVLELYEKMEEAFLLSEMILPCILKACANTGNLLKGKEIHNKIVKYMDEYDVVVGSSLVDMYAKCGSLDEAREMFEKLSNRNLVLWGAMIGGYMQQERGPLALELFEHMLQDGIEPDSTIFVHVLKACVNIGALIVGKVVHHIIVEVMNHMHMVVVGALVDMYARCGTLKEAQDTTLKSVEQSIAVWGSVIAGCAQYGDWISAEQIVENMQKEGTKPNQTIITSVLSACGHAGQAEEGRKFLESMAVCNAIVPNFENFTCVIGLLGSAGHLEDAVHLLETMPAASDVTGWTSFLTACKTYGKSKL